MDSRIRGNDDLRQHRNRRHPHQIFVIPAKKMTSASNIRRPRKKGDIRTKIFVVPAEAGTHFAPANRRRGPAGRHML
jgi:hypothetical protein